MPPLGTPTQRGWAEGGGGLGRTPDEGALGSHLPYSLSTVGVRGITK